MKKFLVFVVLWLLICISTNTHCAGEQNNFSATEQLFRHIVLTEPQAEHPNPYAWKLDDTKTAAAIACVDKEWNALHKKYIAGPREAFTKAHKKHFAAMHLNSSLFNRSTQYCCLVSENEQIKAFFGTESQLNVITLRPCKNSYLIKPIIISSTLITYHDVQKQKKVLPAFQIILSIDSTQTPQAGIILPNEKQYYGLDFKKHPLITSYAITLNKLIQATFDLSEDPDFWNYRFEKDGITVKRELTSSAIEINVEHNCFAAACHNLSELNHIEKSFKDNSCCCDTKYIDPVCMERYEAVCNILAKEGPSRHKKSFLELFFARHIRHKIGCIQVEGHTKTIYINPYGELYRHSRCNDIDNYSGIFNSNRYDATVLLSIDKLQEAASTHARIWQIAGNLLLKSSKNGDNEQNITYLLFNSLYSRGDLTLKNDVSVIDGTTVDYNGHYVTIFALQSPSKPLLLLFYNDNRAEICDHLAKNQDALKKGLAYLLREKKKKSYEVAAPENDIIAFMRFVKGLANPINDIKDIYPSEDFYAKYPFLIL